MREMMKAFASLVRKVLLALGSKAEMLVENTAN